jgi:hypothetical protein
MKASSVCNIPDGLPVAAVRSPQLPITESIASTEGRSAARLGGVAQSRRSATFTMGQPISVRQALSSEVSGGPTR